MRRFDGSLQLLTAVQTVGAAPLLLRKWRRFRRRRDSYEWDAARWNGRWLTPPSPLWSAKTGPHLSFYADGFAETRLAVQLIRALEIQRPDGRFSLTIRNLRDAQNGHAIPPDLPLSALPFDYLPAVKRWFQTVRPDGVVMIEKLFYPTFVRGAAALGARVMGVNSYARASDCRKNIFFKRWILAGFSALGLRSSEQQTLLEPLVELLRRATSCEVTGSLKFPAPRQNSALETRPELRKWLDLAGEKPILAAGSVEGAEIEILCAAFALLRRNCDAVLLLAPRHIAAAGEIKSQLEARGWRVARRSDVESENGAPDVLLLDTMGELTSVYARCEGAFVGGTFAGGGHNVLEPLGAGIPVVFGPKRGFFAAEQVMCEANGVGTAVQDAQSLAAMWQTMIENAVYRREVRERIAVFVFEGQKSWDATVIFLLKELANGEKVS